MKTKVITLAALALLTVACQKDDQSNFQAPTFSTGGDIKELTVPKSFDFSTAREIEASITVRGLKDQPLGGKRISFYKGDPDFGAELLGVGVTNPAGMLDMPLQVPAYTEDIYVVAHAAGFANKQVVSSSSNIQIDFGGTPQRDLVANKAAGTQSLTPISGNYYYMGGFTTGSEKGLPNYLEANGDVI
ncbi:unnamed protein product, partial [Laminaria digitata]